MTGLQAKVLRSQGQYLEEGFSLIEVLVSLLIVSIGLAALFPVLSVIAYQREISERIEVAKQLARDEEERIRTLVELELVSGDFARFTDPVNGTTEINAFVNQLPTAIGNTDTLDTIPPPASIPSTGSTTAANYTVELAQVGVPDDPNPQQYAIQSFRTPGEECVDPITQAAITGLPCVFSVGIRVYHRFSFDESRDALSGLTTETFFANQFAGSDANLRPLANLRVDVNKAGSLQGQCNAGATTSADQTRCANL